MAGVGWRWLGQGSEMCWILIGKGHYVLDYYWFGCEGISRPLVVTGHLAITEL